MGILVVAVLATCVGFVLILLIGRNQPVSPASPQFAGLEVATELAWVRDFGVEGFQRLLLTLFAEMGFNPERSERGAHSVDLYALDPTPIRGGRVYVHGVLGTPGKPIEADEVRNLIETARGEFIGKGVLVTLGRISADARDTARGNPIDLLDGDELARLVKKHLPQAYATRRV